MGIRFTLLLLLLLAPYWGHARPVSYPGGSTLMFLQDERQETVYYHYSPSHKYSLGIELVDEKHATKNHANLRYTYLLNRNNTKNSQRNLYFQSSLSASGNDEYSYGLLGDWETRRYFIGFGAKELKSNMRDYSKQFVQIGFAPYLGNYGDLHSWLMVKSKHDSLTDEWNSYPVVKFFKGDYLLELGVDENDELDLYFMIRF